MSSLNALNIKRKEKAITSCHQFLADEISPLEKNRMDIEDPRDLDTCCAGTLTSHESTKSSMCGNIVEGNSRNEVNRYGSKSQMAEHKHSVRARETMDGSIAFIEDDEDGSNVTFYDCKEEESDASEKNSVASYNSESSDELNFRLPGDDSKKGECSEHDLGHKLWNLQHPEEEINFSKNESIDSSEFEFEEVEFENKLEASPATKNLSLKSNPELPRSPPLELLKTLEITQLKSEKTEAFFLNNGMSVAIAGLFFALNIVVGAHAAYQFTEQGGFYTDNDILRITLPIARVGGRLVTFNCAWILLTACKYLWTMVRSHVVPILPIGFPIDDIMPKYHRFVALWVIFFGNIVHALPQILNYAIGAIKIDDGSKIWTFGDGFATRQLLITGVLLMFIFAMFFLTTLKAFRRTTTGFRWFWLFHVGGIALVYPLLIVHGTFRGHPIFLFCALAPLVLYLFDVVMRRSKISNAKILQWKTHTDEGQNIIELVVECPPHFFYTPGQYAELRFSPISIYEWHPFTIASAPNNDTRMCNGKETKVLIFFIKASGRWTQALFQYAAAFDLSKADMKVSVRGPHGAPAANFLEYKDILVIGSGVGVVPLLSVWQYIVGRSKKQDNIARNVSFSKRLSRSLNSTMKRMSSMSSLSLYGLDEKDRTDDHTFVFETTAQEEEVPSKFRKRCSRAKDTLESITTSIFLYIFFLAFETVLVVMQIYGHYTEVAQFESLFASLSLAIHVGTIFVSTCSLGFAAYILQLKCWVEIAITTVDALNLWLSISFLEGTSDNSYLNSTQLIVILGAVSVFLHAIRIFHVFYTTLKPKNSVDDLDSKRHGNRVSSIQGIFINRHFNGMKFCFEQLIEPLEGDNLNCSLDFYGTQEKSQTRSIGMPIDGQSLDSFDLETSGESIASWVGNEHCYSFHHGRPDFESIFHKAIQKAQRSGTNHACAELRIGVFFCGSPAIAKSLRSAADKVNAQHQFAEKRMKGNYRKCKIVVHVENY